jgi:hypothetical protein
VAVQGGGAVRPTRVGRGTAGLGAAAPTRKPDERARNRDPSPLHALGYLAQMS